MKDSFDEFLKKEVEKSSCKILDDGFSDRVIKNLPQRENYFFKRRTIIIIFSFLSGFVFLMVNGINQFILGMANFISGLIYYSSINLEFLIVLMIFSIMTLLIPFVEFRRRVL